MRGILQRTSACISVVLLLSSMGALLNVQVAYAGTNEVTFQSSAMAGINQTRANFVAAVANQAHDYFWNTLGFTAGKEIESELDDIVHINYDDLGFPTTLSYGATSYDSYQNVNITLDDTLANYTTYELALNATIAHEVFHVTQVGYAPRVREDLRSIGWHESTAQALEAIAVQGIWGQADPTYLDPINQLGYLGIAGGNYMGNPDLNLLDLPVGSYTGVLFWIYEQRAKEQLKNIFSDVQGATDPFNSLQNRVGGADKLKELFRDYAVSLVTESRRAGLTKTSTIYPLSASVQIDEPTYVTIVNAPQNRDSFSSTVNLWGADFIKVNYKKISVPLSIRFNNKGNNDVLAVAVWRVGNTYHSFQLQNDARTLFNVKNADEFVVAITQVGSSRTGAADDYEIRITQSLDMIFTIDVTGSMGDDIAAVKAAATDIANTILTKTEGVARFAIVAYRDFPYYPYGEPDDIMFEDYAFTNITTTIINNINVLTASGGADWPEAVFEALLRAIDATTVGGWIRDASKFIILAGDAPHHEVCPVGLTINDVITAAEAADPVIIHSIVVGYDYDAISQFSTIANDTEGIFLNPTSPEEFAEAVNIVVHEILLIPDLAASLEAPATIEPGTSVWLSATVRNTRLNRNETNVELQLLINGSIVNSVIIAELQANTSYVIGYLWTPTVKGIYNVTAYAPPVPEEERTANNVASKIVQVCERDVAVVNVAPSKTVVGQGYCMNITVTVENQGDLPETFKVFAYYDELVIPTPEQGETFWSMGDVNRDGYIDDIDMSLIEAAWLSTPGAPNWNPDADLNKDLVVYFEDLFILMSNYGLDIWTYFELGTPPIGTQIVVNLPKGTSTTITFTWNTAGFAKGNYTIKAYAWPVTGENDTSDNTLADGWVVVTIPGDIDGSFSVDGGDLGLLGLAWYSKPGDSNWNPNADINDDGLVDGGDLGLLGFNWFQTA